MEPQPPTTPLRDLIEAARRLRLEWFAAAPIEGCVLELCDALAAIPPDSVLVSRAEVDALRKFWREVREGIFDGIDGPDCQEMAEVAGLFECHAYDPARDPEPEVDAEAGDVLYYDTPASRAALGQQGQP